MLKKEKFITCKSFASTIQDQVKIPKKISSGPFIFIIKKVTKYHIDGLETRPLSQVTFPKDNCEEAGF